ncbi:putative exported protein [Ehrlichia ruminantium]|uniref:hypothetical protein n=1 Tax=Ehrlichia ruminantium TaxID=779 RepID=UPI0007C142F3|nr:hypothetical protein [Ehrlichia ruminantium]QLK52639.1 hypothetical protein FDZ65_03985 [Ehrlichia ruminantium]QLK54471.1 hypothetical protein FDZ63_03985 [Ehrlichia ruminantium]QLK57222.1 hypothetical protein FDZ60_03995 [Ehrlichia ruminantium]GAT76569.1 putative exported protein [Ehrlichia ruminantium]
MNFQTCIALTVVTSVLLLACIIAMVKVFCKLKKIDSSIAGVARTNLMYYGSTRSELRDLSDNITLRVNELKSELLYLSDELTRHLYDKVLDIYCNQNQSISDQRSGIDEKVAQSSDPVVHSDIQHDLQEHTETEQVVPEVKKQYVMASEEHHDQNEHSMMHVNARVMLGESRDVKSTPSKEDVKSSLDYVELRHVNSEAMNLAK